MTAVSQETVAQVHSGKSGRVRDRCTDARTRRGDARRAQVIDAVIASARDGNFRPSFADLTERTGIPGASVARLFGKLHLLYRVVARQHVAEICDAMRGADALEERDIAWLIMVGKRRERP